MDEINMEQLQKELEFFLDGQGIRTTKIPNNRNYWFIRTYGGKFFDVFIHNKAVGLGWGWDDTSDPKGEIAKDLQDKYWDILSRGKYSDIPPHNEASIEALAKKISKIMNVENKDSRKKNKKDGDTLSYIPQYVRTYIKIASKAQALLKILRFEKAIGIGDIIVIPSVNSSQVMIGEVISNVDIATISNDLYKTKDQKQIVFPSKRIRYVKWLHERPISSNTLNPKLIPLLCSQHSLTNATDKYASYIEQTIYPIYNKNKLYHLNIPVKSNKNFDIMSYIEFFNHIEYIRGKISTENKIDLYSQELDIKLNIQSPGFIEFISNNKEIIYFLATLIVIWGFELNFEAGIKFSIKVNGIQAIQGIFDRIIELHRINLDHKFRMNFFEAYYPKKFKRNKKVPSLFSSVKLDEHYGVEKNSKKIVKNNYNDQVGSDD